MCCFSDLSQSRAGVSSQRSQRKDSLEFKACASVHTGFDLCALCDQKIAPKRDQAIRNIKGYSALAWSVESGQKETPEPLNRERSRKEFQGQRLHRLRLCPRVNLIWDRWRRTIHREPAVFEKIEFFLHTERIDAYRQDGADEQLTLAHYPLNLALSESLYLTLQFAEIAQRNAIHQALTTKCCTDTWYHSPHARITSWQHDDPNHRLDLDFNAKSRSRRVEQQVIQLRNFAFSPAW